MATFSRLFKITASLGVAASGLFLFYGYVTPVQIQDQKLKSSIFLYRDLGGEKGSSKTRILNHLQADLSDLGSADYTIASVFYHDSRIDNMEAPKGHQRLIVGAMLDPSQAATVQNFIIDHPEYTATEIKDMDVVGMKFPYRGSLSFSMLNFRDIYGDVMKFASQKKGVRGDDSYFIEQYPFVNGKKNNIEVMMPYGNNMRQLDIGRLQVPLYAGPVSHLMRT